MGRPVPVRPARNQAYSVELERIIQDPAERGRRLTTAFDVLLELSRQRNRSTAAEPARRLEQADRGVT